MRLFSVCLCMTLTPVGLCDAEEKAFRSLFDGNSLKGWKGNEEWFRVENGAIIAGTMEQGIPRNEFLCTEKEYADFELRLSVKVRGEGANAGIQIRSRRIPNNHEMIGYQADVGANWWGKLYDESRRRRILAAPDETVKMSEIVKPDTWNEYVIRCQGRRIRLWLNGVQTVDYTEPDSTIEQIGLIGVQIHGGPPSEAWYKDIRIKPL